MRNQFFNNFNYSYHQDTIESLIIESIKIYGHDVRYIPREIVKDDMFLGEDVLSTFDAAAEIEMYIKNVEGFEGEGDFLGKFNLEIRDRITFTVAAKRFDQARSEKLATEVGFNYLYEDATIISTVSDFGPQAQDGEIDNIINIKRESYIDGFFLSPGFVEDNNKREALLDIFVIDDCCIDTEPVSIGGEPVTLETATSQGYSISNTRPFEGDLIYFPLVNKLFEIKFVEHENMFYQHGKLQVYDIQCELFEYSSERINTGIEEIDVIEDNYTTDELNFEVINEDNSKLIQENDSSLIHEFNIEDISDVASNEEFTNPEFEGAPIIDWTEQNPFNMGVNF